MLDKSLRIGLACSLAFGLAACKALEDDDPLSIPTGPTGFGAVTVQIDASPPEVTATFAATCSQVGPFPDRLTVRIRSLVLLDQETGVTTDDFVPEDLAFLPVDLIQFAGGPTTLGTGPVENGTYDCVRIALGPGVPIDPDAEIESDECQATVPEIMREFDLCLDGDALEVNEDAHTVLMRLPVCFGQCLPEPSFETADGTISIVAE